jgi:hypothetical protein
MIGLGSIAPGAKTAAPAIDPEVAKEMFAQLYALKCPCLNELLILIKAWK